MSLIFKLLLLIFINLSSFALDEIYFLPKDSSNAKKSIEKLIESSNSTIDIAVYNFEYKKIAKLLKKASTNGVVVNIIFDNKKRKKKNSQYKKLCKNSNIICSVVKDLKQHIKLIIFDKKIAMFGSANLTKESFNKNNELIYITDNKVVLKKLNLGFNNFLNTYK